MQSQFSQQPNWTVRQEKVLYSNPNLIVSGCAGSGKTLLACHLAMRYTEQIKVAILVYTKSLRTFIRDYLESLKKNNITVLYSYEWQSWNFPKFDLIIVDEYQDFSMQDISKVIQSALHGIYLFGDIYQQVYLKNTRKEETLNFQELIHLKGFKHLFLNDNFRISNENTKLITTLFKGYSLTNSTFSTGSIPKILPFEDVDHEINWLIEFLQRNTEFKNIGILIKKNDGYLGGYYHRKKLRKDKIFGIIELHEILNENGIISTYKYKSNDNLDFTREVNINILTYHSSKGLQFDCIIMPFSNYVSNNMGIINLPYVALTRASKQIIITYSGLIADEYSVPVSTSLFSGSIIRKAPEDNYNHQVELDEFTIEQLKNNPTFKLAERIVKSGLNDETSQSEIERLTIELIKDKEEFQYLKNKSQESLDISDCEIFKH